jgi:hypothetical protein
MLVAPHLWFRFAPQQISKRREFQTSNILLHARIEEPSILMGEWRLAEDSNR